MCIQKLIASHVKELLEHLVNLDSYCYNKSVHLNSVCYAFLIILYNSIPTKHKHLVENEFPQEAKKLGLISNS